MANRKLLWPWPVCSVVREWACTPRSWAHTWVAGASPSTPVEGNQCVSLTLSSLSQIDVSLALSPPPSLLPLSTLTGKRSLPLAPSAPPVPSTPVLSLGGTVWPSRAVSNTQPGPALWKLRAPLLPSSPMALPGKIQGSHPTHCAEAGQGPLPSQCLHDQCVQNNT